MPHKQETITVKYECTETGQEITIAMKYRRNEKNTGWTIKTDVEFNPYVGDDMEDPFGFAGKIIDVLRN